MSDEPLSVCCSPTEHGGPGVEDGGDAGLGDGDGLLLHGLVDRHAVRVTHLCGAVRVTEALHGFIMIWLESRTVSARRLALRHSYRLVVWLWVIHSWVTLSNSSMQTMPPSPSTMAPPSRLNSPLASLRPTHARPTAPHHDSVRSCLSQLIYGGARRYGRTEWPACSLIRNAAWGSMQVVGTSAMMIWLSGRPPGGWVVRT